VTTLKHDVISDMKIRIKVEREVSGKY